MFWKIFNFLLFIAACCALIVFGIWFEVTIGMYIYNLYIGDISYKIAVGVSVLTTLLFSEVYSKLYFMSENIKEGAPFKKDEFEALFKELKNYVLTKFSVAFVAFSGWLYYQLFF